MCVCDVLKLIDVTFARSEKKIITKVAWKIFSDLIIFKLFDLIILILGNKLKTMMKDTDKIYLYSVSYSNNISNKNHPNKGMIK